MCNCKAVLRGYAMYRLAKYLIIGLKKDISHTLYSAWQSGVGKNAASLYLIQFANYILPLILVPYLVRVLRPEFFGLVSFGQGLIAYFNILVDYGFALSATRRISVERNDLVAVSKTASSIWAAKGLFCLLGLCILLLLTKTGPKFQKLDHLFLILYGTVVGGALFPIWLFQGMEKMFFISLINLSMRLIIVAFVFLLVRNPEHYLLYAALTSLGAIGAGLIGMIVAIFKFRIRLILPSFEDIKQVLKEGWFLFLSTASISLYTAGNAFILGLLTNPTVVGYYSAAEKIVKGVMNLLGPVREAAYPRFSKLALESKAKALYWVKRLMLVMSGLGLLLSLALFLGAPLIVNLLLGSEYRPSVGILRVLAGVPLLVAMSNVLGIQIMLPFGKDRAFMAILFGAGLTNIAFAMLLAPRLQAIGMATAVLLSETFVTTSMFIYLQQCGLNPLSRKFSQTQSLLGQEGNK